MPKRAVHGVLLFDKPLGLSSNDALQKVKRLYRAEKAGHTGTLDPLATGLLPLCFGAATKFSQISLEADKRYTATLKLGITTDTADAEGQVLQMREVILTREQIEVTCQQFVGSLEQVPPMYSALKREGRPLYEYARAGIEVERESRQITIHKIEILDWQRDQLVIDVTCSKGTYVRTLAQDIGEVLGCGAHLGALLRTGCGPLMLNKACTLAQLEAATEVERDAWLMTTDALLSDTSIVRLDAENAGRFLSGVRRRVDMHDEIQVRVYGPEDHAFLGSAHIKAGELISTRLLSPLEVRGLPRMSPFLTSKL
jgi:tRNA pseudouridine55 synthase